MALGKYSTKSSPVERHVDMEQTGMNRGREDLGSRRGARDDAVESRERRREGGGQGSSFGVCMCVHPCAGVCGQEEPAGERREVGREDNWALQTELTFGSRSTGENLMRTKICLPNSPKKSLKHFVIPKCLENELVALQEPFRASSAVRSSRSPTCLAQMKPPKWGGGSQPLTCPCPTQTSGLPRASVSPSQGDRARMSPRLVLPAGARPFRSTYRQTDKRE